MPHINPPMFDEPCAMILCDNSAEFGSDYCAKHSDNNLTI